MGKQLKNVQTAFSIAMRTIILKIGPVWDTIQFHISLFREALGFKHFRSTVDRATDPKSTKKNKKKKKKNVIK